MPGVDCTWVHGRFFFKIIFSTVPDPQLENMISRKWKTNFWLIPRRNSLENTLLRFGGSRLLEVHDLRITRGSLNFEGFGPPKNGPRCFCAKFDLELAGNGFSATRNTYISRFDRPKLKKKFFEKIGISASITWPYSIIRF
jgi:hypothetical protein